MRRILAALLLSLACRTAFAGLPSAELETLAAARVFGQLRTPPLPPPPRPYRAVRAESTFKVFGQSAIKDVEGIFEEYDVKAWLDLERPTESRLTVVVAMGSVSSDTFLVPTFMLRNALKVTEFPETTVQSRSVRAGAAPGTFEAEVDIRFMGRDFRATAPLSLSKEGDHVRLKGSCALDLSGSLHGRVEFDLVLEKTGG